MNAGKQVSWSETCFSKPQFLTEWCGFCLYLKISSAACGYGFTLLASNTKDITKVWGMGLNKDSQLGFQRSRRDQSKDLSVLKTYRVTLQFACGTGIFMCLEL